MMSEQKNGLEKLAELTGVSRDTMMAVAQQVKENHRKLNSCSYHEFELMPGFTETDLKRKYACQHCAGTIDGSAYFWHEKGRQPKGVISL